MRITRTPTLLVALLLVGLLASGCVSIAASHGQRGLQAVEARRWSEALSAFERAVRDEPDQLRWRRGRVRAALRAGQLPGLLERLRQRADQGSPADRYELALALATEGEPQSDAEALRILAQVAEQLPDEADIPYRMGLLRLEQERFDEAVAVLERAVELGPREPGYRVALAEALARSGHEDRAREVLWDLPTLEPSEADLGRARAILGRLNSPQRHIPEALREAYHDALLSLAEEGSSPGEAVRLIEEALRIAPECAPLITLNGLASVRLGQLGRARAAFERALELWPGDPVPRLELAALAVEAEDLAEAEGHLEAALRADPLNEQAWAELGRVRYQRQRYDGAVDAFRRLIQLDGGLTLSLLWLGRALRRADRDDEAERVYLELLENHPETFEAFLQLGHIYRQRRLEEPDRERAAELLRRARQYYRQALELRPQDPMVRRALEALEDGP